MTETASPPGSDKRPLTGRRVLIARSAEKAGELQAALQALGANCSVLPVIRHEAVPRLDALRTAIGQREAYSHVVFTSQTAVRYFAEGTAALGAPVATWRQARVAAVGGKTASALREAGLEPALIAEGGAASLARDLLEKEGLGPGSRILLPRSSIGRPDLPEALEAAGVIVDAVTLYDTVPEATSKAGPLLAEAFARGAPDALIFSSPSAFSAFLHLAGAGEQEALRNGQARIVSIGSTTSDAIRKQGFEVAAEAASPTAAELARATVRAVTCSIS